MRLCTGRVAASRPSIEILPEVGVSKPASIRNVVVLPQPLGPSSEKNSLLPTVKETSFTATVPAPKRLVTRSTRIAGVSSRATGSVSWVSPTRTDASSLLVIRSSSSRSATGRSDPIDT